MVLSKLYISPARLCMSPDRLTLVEMLVVVVEVERLYMSPANTEDETAMVKSDAQRIDLKRVILILLMTKR